MTDEIVLYPGRILDKCQSHIQIQVCIKMINILFFLLRAERYKASVHAK